MIRVEDNSSLSLSLRLTQHSRRYQCAICCLLRRCFYPGLYPSPTPSLAKMSLSKRRKVDTECRFFNEKWTTSYLFMEMHGKPLCLVCLQQVSVLKEYNIRRHYETLHSEKYDGLQGQLRRDKINELQAGLRKQQSTFIQSRQVSEAAK